MTTLFADEYFDFAVVAELRRLGHDVLTAADAGLAGQGTADIDILTFATASGRAVLTFDRLDFMRLHRQVAAHAGIIVCTWDRDRIALAQRIHQALLACPDLNGQLIRVNRPPAP